MNRLVLAVLAALAAAAPLAADAQTGSRRWGSFDLGVERYRPDIDSEFGLIPGPYEQIFGSSRGWMFRLGASRALFTGLGSLEVGLRAGYFQERGRALLEDGTPSEVHTTFRILPTSAAVTYRFDWPVERYGIPLAPYARAALERYWWWVSDVDGTSERGATNGWSATGGIAFLLDILDRGLARELDRDTGVNHTYLFAEITHTSVDDFGSGSSWDLSNDGPSYAFGLMFVF